MNPSYTPAFVTNSVVKRARASLTVGVLGLGQRDISSRHMPSTSALVKSLKSSSAHINYPVFPTDAAALAQTIASGVYPSEHGIMSSAWPSMVNTSASSNGFTVARAFENEAHSSKTPSLADSIAQAFEGQSLVISASASPVFSAANGVHSAVSAAHPSWTSTEGVANNAELSFNAETGSFELGWRSSKISSALEKALAPPKDAFFSPKAIAALSTPIVAVELSSDKSKVSLVRTARKRLRASETHQLASTLDLSVETHRAVVAELLYAQHLAATIVDANSPLARLVADDVPDLLSFTFSSLPALRAGANVELVRAVQALIDYAIPQLVSAVNKAYDNTAVAQVILYGVNARTHGASSHAQSETAIRVLPEDLQAQARAFFPMLAVPAERLAEVCGAMTARLTAAKAPYTVFCKATEAVAAEVSSFIETEAFVSEGMKVQDLGTADEIGRYQIQLWVGIALFFLTAYSLIGVAFMSFKKDQQLWGVINPAWAGRRH